LVKAEQCRKDGVLKQAADLYSEALRLEKSGNLYNIRGTVYFNMNEY
jgi:hypothetical protein